MLTTLCGFLLAAAQSPAPLAFPLRALAPEDGVAGTALRLDGDAVARLERSSKARLLAPDVDGLAGAVLELERVPSPARGELFIDGVSAGALGAGLELSLWQGMVLGEPDSHVFLGFSNAGSRGWIRRGAAVSHLLAEPGPAGRWDHARLVDERDLAPPTAFACGTGALPQPRYDPARPPSGAGGTSAALASMALYRCRIAVETDFQYFQLFGNLAAAESYALTLFAAVGATYRAEVGVVIELPYLGLYSSPADPWVAQDQGGGAGDLLGEFRDKWQNGAPVPGDLNHFLSGAGLGGGVAWLDVLCSPYWGFGVSGNLGANTPFPVTQGPLNWDYFVVAHELGHNFASPHTHDYCPPLDQCAPNGYWGGCQTQSVCQPGTLMSYCHLCPSGIANVAPAFHPVVRQRIRDAVLASCLLPFGELKVANLGQGYSAGVLPLILGAALDLADRSLEFLFAGAPAPTTGVLVLGATSSPIPLAGGTLVPAPDLLVGVATPVVTGAFGPYGVGNGFPTGVELFAQAWLVDVTAPGFLRASNALRLDIIVPSAPAPLVWIPHPANGLEYALTPPGTWFACEKVAATHGAVLAALDSNGIQAWAQFTFVTSGLAGGSLHIGYTDRYSEGTFQWVSGASGTYTNWATGEPNDWGGTEDFAQWPFNGNQWNDASGYEALRGLVQRPQ